MSKSLAVIFIFASFHLLCLYQSCYGHCQLHFIAAYGITDGELMSRSAATHGKTVRFFETGQSVLWHFTTQIPCTIDVLNVRYSNDGPSDNLTVYLNDDSIESFQSIEHSNGGVFWNKMVETGFIGKSVILFKGNHTLSLNISLVDIHGFEIDEVTLGAICDHGKCLIKIIEHPDNDNGVQEDEKNSWKRSTIIALSFGVLGLVISIPPLILAFWKIYKCIHNIGNQREEIYILADIGNEFNDDRTN